MAEMNMGVLPTIKCSNCGSNVEISSMGDHICIPNDFAHVDLPSPPPSAGLDSNDRLSPKVTREGPPPAIDPSAANRAYLHPNVPTPASSVHPSPHSISPPARSPLRSLQHNVTDDDESVINLDSVFSFPMPGNRSPTEGDSAVSHSSYRTSFASSRYGDSTARSSSNSFSRGLRSFIDETPPIPPAPLRTPNKASFPRDSNLSVVSSRISEEEISGFNFGDHTGHTPTTGLHDLPEESSPTDLENRDDYPTSQPAQTHLHPATAATDIGSDAPRKNSNASTASAFSVTSFARALGLEDQMMNHGSPGSSDSSPSDARSGSSMSSLPSDVSLNNNKPTDPLNLGPLVQELPARSRQTILELPGRVRSTMEDVPPIPAAFFSPDSPTDPAINKTGLSLITEKQELPPIPKTAEETREPRESLSRPPPPQRSFTAPSPQIPQTPSIPRTPTRSSTRTKGTCKGCNEPITGKSVSSSDGRLTGRYHRGCFVCFECHSPFPTADFYVLNNRPFCAQHYHERNGSLCVGCHTGIEGHYLETVERNPARPDRRRFHTQCLQCRTCHVLLKGDYFEWNGEVFCERDARRAAAAAYHPPPPPPGRRRPTVGSSPLAQSGPFPGSYPPPGARMGPGPMGPGPGPGPGLGPGPGPGLYPGPRFPLVVEDGSPNDGPRGL
ncbi:Zinc finger LIM-type [Penicillium sp. DV-2018c]|nr:Zinc finger LIM-type [Penicillium sp. DV-2018c]